MLVLPARLTAVEARDTLRMLATALLREPDSGVVVYASALSHLDSSALAVLLECQRLSQAYGRGFEVRHAPGKLSQLAKLYGVDAVIRLGLPSSPPGN